MKHRVQVESGGLYLRHRQVVAEAARAALRAARARPSEVTLLLADDRTLRRLNRRFAGQDRITDVLSFDGGGRTSQAPRHYLGDVAVSVPRARRQAAASGHSVRSELALLTVHGILHLLGHDHAQVEDRRKMARLHTRALAHLGIALANDPLQG